jgi:hypothetical protein
LLKPRNFPYTNTLWLIKKMRIILKLLPILILVIQCKNVEKIDLQESDWALTKESRDYIEYLKFIQNHPNSINFNKALSEYLFLRDSISDFVGCERYNAKIDAIDNSKVLFNGYLKSIDSLRYFTLHYLINANGEMEVSSKLKYKVKIPQTTLFNSISNGKFEFQFYKKPFPVEYLQPILTEIKNGINDYKNYLSKEWYQTEYSDLTNEKRIEIDELNNRRLVFFDFTDLEDKRFNPPPKYDFNE